MIDDRSISILEAVVQEFIDGGEPVSSGSLYKSYDFGIKPAMIRLELDELEAAGYLEQPYHSAGRIPTDKGYEFFAKKALDSEIRTSREKYLNELLHDRAWAELIGKLSVELGLLSAVADYARESVYKAGLQELVERLEWEDKEELLSVIRDFDEIDGRLVSGKWQMANNDVMRKERNDDRNDPISVFIGKKSPVTRSECLSVIRRNYVIDDAVVSIFAIGPKNMDYKKVIEVLRNL